MTQKNRKRLPNSKVKTLVDDVFKLVERAKNVNDVIQIPDTVNIPNEYRFEIEKYPKLNISLTATDVIQLKKDGFLTDTGAFNSEAIMASNNTLAKLFFVMSWKQGDLNKIKHIVGGIHNHNANINSEVGVVFRQFGKHLGSGGKEPIIDQHVFRSYLVYKRLEDSDIEITTCRKFKTFRKSHLSLLKEYVEWIEKLTINKAEPDFGYHVDHVLFALGKAIS